MEEIAIGCGDGVVVEVLTGSNLLKTSASIGEASFLAADTLVWYHWRWAVVVFDQTAADWKLFGYC